MAFSWSNLARVLALVALCCTPALASGGGSSASTSSGSHSSIDKDGDMLSTGFTHQETEGSGKASGHYSASTSSEKKIPFFPDPKAETYAAGMGYTEGDAKSYVESTGVIEEGASGTHAYAYNDVKKGEAKNIGHASASVKNTFLFDNSAESNVATNGKVSKKGSEANAFEMGGATTGKFSVFKKPFTNGMTATEVDDKGAKAAAENYSGVKWGRRL